MIDTIVLTLKTGMFTILDHDKFNPSTKGIIEFSIPKLLYGNNFDEITDTDFPLIIQK